MCMRDSPWSLDETGREANKRLLWNGSKKSQPLSFCTVISIHTFVE